MSGELLQVDSEGDDRYRTTGTVVAGIGNELVVHRERRPFHELREVVHLGDGLGPVAEPAVAYLDEGPVEELRPRAVGVTVGVEEISGGEHPAGQDEPPCGDSPAHLEQVGLLLLGIATEGNRGSEERAGEVRTLAGSGLRITSPFV